jgi:isopenicillin N synthase-like dioxygenase
MSLEDPDFILKFHSGHNNQLRLLHYPPIPASELESEAAARMPAHSDWGSITMLFQDDCGGLEVENQHVPGEFIKVQPVKDALVMNIGDLLMRWSNGVSCLFTVPLHLLCLSLLKEQSVSNPNPIDWLKSTLHRVTLPPASDRFTGAERMTRARYSIPYFISPDIDARIEVMPECTTESNPSKYEPVIQREYRLMRAKLQYPEKASQAVTASG